MIDRIFTALSFRLRCLLILLSGGVMALAMPPTNFWPLLFIGLSLFYGLLTAYRGWRAFLLGWLFGFGYFVIGLYWIGNALLVPGNDFKWAWPLAVLGLPFALAFFTGIAGWAAARIADLKTWRGYAAVIFCLMASEWLRGVLFTGFPWNLYGYGWAGMPELVQSVSLFGTYGLTLLTIAWGLLPGFLYVAGKSRRAGAAACAAMILLWAGLYGWGAHRLAENPTRSDSAMMVRIVQPNIAQEDKWNSDRIVANIQKTVDLSAAPFLPGKIYAVIWPETAITDYVIRDPNAADFIRAALFPGNRPGYLLSGVLRHETDADGKPVYYNSLVAYDSDLIPEAIYDKAHLVPFGEYIPYQKYIPLRPVVQFSGFTAGQGVATQTLSALPSFSGLVCYEVLFPGRSALTEPRPHWIVNATNDGWYGDSPGPYQHLMQTVYRATEEGLPLARAANTGISALIDSYGRILHKTGYNKDGYIDAALPQRTENPTFYSRFREIPLLISMLGLGLFVMSGFRPGKAGAEFV